MPTSELIIRLVAGLLLTLGNAFFVVTEFALTRLPQLDDDASRGDKGLRYAWKMVDELEIYLTGCQLGITTTSILLGIVTEPAVTSLISPAVSALGFEERSVSVISVALAVVVINLIHKIWGEQAPTYLGVEKPKEIARFTGPVHYWWSKIMYPIIKLGDGLAKRTLRLFGIEISRSWIRAETDGKEVEAVGSRTELKRKMVDLLKQQNVSSDRREEVIGALDIDEIPVRDVMVPREEIVSLSTEKSADENLRVACKHMLSRFPLVRGTVDECVGTIYVPVLLREQERLLKSETMLEDLASPAVTVPASCSVSDLIDLLQEEDQELCLIEEDGRVVGLMTITDAFETIAGELRDPLDRTREHLRGAST